MNPHPSKKKNLCYLHERHVGDIKEILKVFFLPLNGVSSRALQLPTLTVYSVSQKLLPQPESPESLFYGLTKLPNFCQWLLKPQSPWPFGTSQILLVSCRPVMPKTPLSSAWKPPLPRTSKTTLTQYSQRSLVKVKVLSDMRVKDL